MEYLDSVRQRDFDNAVDGIIRRSKLADCMARNFYKEGDYLSLYSGFNQQKVFAALHGLLNYSLDGLIERKVGADNMRYLKAIFCEPLLSVIDAWKLLNPLFAEYGIHVKLSDKYSEILGYLEGKVQLHGSSIEDSPLFSSFYTDRKKPIFSFIDTVKVETVRFKDEKLVFIGCGSYGDVYKFHDPFLDIDVVKKVLKKDSSEKETRRFEQEFRTLKKKLYSPNIIEVYNYDESTNSFTMECMDGNIENLCQSGISEEVRFDIAGQVFRAVSYLHAKGFVHRDLHPTNFLYRKYDDGSYVIKLSDLGLVKDPTERLSSSGSSVKGHFPDPALELGFEKAEPVHDMIGLAKTIIFILTGKLQSSDSKLADLLQKAVQHKLKSAGDMKEYCIKHGIIRC